jgi:hypothetical protein
MVEQQQYPELAQEGEDGALGSRAQLSKRNERPNGRGLPTSAHSSSFWPWRGQIPRAVGPTSDCWVSGDELRHCPICEVEFGMQHKHVTRRHCRKCGGLFCYTCTYDKANLRVAPASMCMPFSGKTCTVHVCTNCYDDCPPPADGLRRCRFCHQRVRATLPSLFFSRGETRSTQTHVVYVHRT